VLAEKRPMVLATGGGIVASPDTYALLKKSAVTVWLRASPEDHWNRVVGQGDRRPMADHPQAMADLRALLAARVAPRALRRRAAMAGLWLAALCPFIANYSTVFLSEVLATFLTALALAVLASGFNEYDDAGGLRDRFPDDYALRQPRIVTWLRSPWCLGGLVAGFGTLVRPEAPLLLAAAGVVLLRPASPGTGVIAGGPVRAVLECAGIHDVLSRSLGSSNPINVVHATVAALKSLNRPEEIAAKRGLPIEDVAPAAMLRARAAAAGA